jgi:sarcosine oxidase
LKAPKGESVRRQRWDAIVIGCGVMGAAVSYNLALRGLRVLNLERFGTNNKFGSSHGRTRIIRLAYYEDPRYVPLLRRAFDLWKDLEARSGRRLLLMTGGLMIGKPHGELVTGVLRSAEAHGIPHKVLSSSEVAGRFGAFTLNEEFCAVHEESAGVLFAEESVESFVRLAIDAGCQFEFGEEVKGWTGSSDGVRVETSMGTLTAGAVALCAGAWNGRLLRGVLPLSCERQVPMWFSSGGQDIFRSSEMPVFIMEEEKDTFYYGIPDVGHGVKVARTHGGEIGEPDNVRREVVQRDIAPVREFIARRLKRLDNAPIASTTCIYSNTPDLNFAVGQHPDDDRVIVVSACSGHGFKFASVLGEVVADMITGKNPMFDISFLRVGRFMKGAGGAGLPEPSWDTRPSGKA